MNRNSVELDLIRSAARRDRLIFLGIGLGIMLIGILLFLPKPPKDLLWFAWIMRLLFLAGGGAFLWMRISQEGGHGSPVLRLLAERPGDIVWIFASEQRVRYVAFGVVPVAEGTMMLWVMLCMKDGKIQNMLATGGSANQLLEAFSKVVPHARIGWTEELAEQFQKNPGSLVG